MLRNVIQKVFDVREGEFKVSFWMLSYIFLIIAVLLIVKPTVNALFLSELGIEQLPFAFLIVAITAVISSFFYSKALARYSLNKIIEITLISSVVILVSLGILLKLDILGGWLLYIFYIWVAIYAVLSASQFWVLANLVYNVREAKRLFGFIGSGAILGGIFGGYLTSFLAPLIGTENLIFLAAFLLSFCIPLLRKIWRLRIRNLGRFKEKKRMVTSSERPWNLILKSKHLTYIACIVAVSVLVAKLVDYLFSDFASAAILDPDELTSFFAFWFSTFNLVSLVIQLFFTQRIVGIWGVGFSLLLLPIGIFAGSLFFLILPELSAVVVIKAMDGILKQSVHKSATELLALPLPFDLKNKTKSFIDVVVDSIATGLAGFLLIFVIQGLELPSFFIAVLIMMLVGLWVFFILKVRTEYYKTFRKNLESITLGTGKKEKVNYKQSSVLQGMRTVFKTGSEEQILFMLGKLMEINDKRFENDVQDLLRHPSTKVRTAALQNMYFINNSVMVADLPSLLHTDDDALTLATLEYMLAHAGKNSDWVYQHYLDHDYSNISETALYCLAREARDNPTLKSSYRLKERIAEKIKESAKHPEDNASLKILLKTIGVADMPEFYPLITENFRHDSSDVVETAITAAGFSMNAQFIDDLLLFLPNKRYRATAAMALQNYGHTMISLLSTTIKEKNLPVESIRFIPMVIKGFGSQEAVRHLFHLLEDADLTIRLETIRALSDIRRSNPELKFNRFKVVAIIYEECKLHHKTLSAMHTQIIISYRNRKKSNQEIKQEEREARTSLLELLERRLDAGLERIFKLLGLRYPQKDVDIAYEGLQSEKQEARINALEFLDNLLTGDLKRTLLPIIEESSLDISSEEVLQKIKHKVPSELECFQLLLEGKDLKVKLAVLYLIKQQKNIKYLPIVDKLTESQDIKVRTFAEEAKRALQGLPTFS
jgi:AAA family ATP:ADP antiporter